MPPRPKIEKMPAPVRQWLERVLLDRSHDGYVALSALLKERGFDISHAAVHRFDQSLQRSMADIRATQEAARMIVEAAPDEADEQSAAVIRMVQSQLFTAMLRLREAEDADPAEKVKLLSQAARAAADTSRASVGNKRWAQEVRQRLDTLEQEARKQGVTLDAATLAHVRLGLYGG